jgi:hypothetical protein
LLQWERRWEAVTSKMKRIIILSKVMVVFIRSGQLLSFGNASYHHGLTNYQAILNILYHLCLYSTFSLFRVLEKEQGIQFPRAFFYFIIILSTV